MKRRTECNETVISRFDEDMPLLSAVDQRRTPTPDRRRPRIKALSRIIFVQVLWLMALILGAENMARADEREVSVDVELTPSLLLLEDAQDLDATSTMPAASCG